MIRNLHSGFKYPPFCHVLKAWHNKKGQTTRIRIIHPIHLVLILVNKIAFKDAIEKSWNPGAQFPRRVPVRSKI